ncbi:MAG: transglutaminase domain-containing protein [Chloroflexi bacterium]|nr:transglutaminase domain-containing protein [Chloroflexota bacterium]
MSFEDLTERFKEDWPSVLLLVALMTMPVWALATANWIADLDRLFVVMFVGIAGSYLLAVSKLRDLLVLPFSVLYGLFTVWVVSAGLTDQSLSNRDRLMEVINTMVTWVTNALDGSIPRDTVLPFFVLLAMLVWLISFNAVINTFRTHRLWYATIPPGLGLLINNFYYFGEARLELFLIGYLFLTFTLAVRTNAATREQIWRYERVSYTPGIQFDLLRAGVIGGVVLIALAWMTPTASANSRLSAMWDSGANPWFGVQETLDRLFNGVDGGMVTTADYYGGATLSMGGPVNLGNQTVMVVYAPEENRYYWRSKIFDQYSNGRWTTSAQRRVISNLGVLHTEEDQFYALRRNVQQRVEIQIPATRLLYAASIPVSFTSVDITYDIISTQESSEFATVAAVRAAEVVNGGDSYGATSSISVADQTSLRNAFTEYPAWVTERYLQLPETITDRTVDLAETVTAPYDNPYDKARAVEAYLRENITYNDQVALPPRGVEPVDHLLFERPEGYCNYYASAMTVMLRSQGVPTRIVGGFSQGEYDPEVGGFVVRESNAHTWVEVYFPGYGWIEFEPTASESVVERPESSPVQPDGTIVDRDDEQLPDGGEFEEDNPEDAPQFDVPEEQAAENDQAAGQAQFTLPQITIPGPVRWAFGGVLLLAVAGVGGWYVLEVRGLSDLSEASKSYARVNSYLPLTGIDIEESATPFERQQAIGSSLPDAAPPISQITELYVEEQYGKPTEHQIKIDKREDIARLTWPEARKELLKAIGQNVLRGLNPFSRNKPDDPA